ncbi:hypothetical protein GCM10008090_32170 [Arenicella chitinivorans]|uniref:DUF1415 domain-containing protein n=1 Tax=Arenicella chitinivorans TaxID=1329800 RepID=A0A918S4B6_9GAMM|nr:DUF1415 domain-containing protein [Arenicella chitinivorans]GHA19945.1 hypothetical protein GCM10008090_32170 [Arenicella chitinivorans]
MNEVVKAVERWLTAVVIELNLCPFAQREYRSNRVRFKASDARNEEAVLRDLVVEMSLLTRRPDIETTLLILPYTLSDFLYFNEFLGFADQLLEEMQLDGVYQIASFHPQYQFDGTESEDAENYTNRAPYPILHILRESSLSKVIERHPDPESIPANNIQLMNTLGKRHMQLLLKSIVTDDQAQ